MIYSIKRFSRIIEEKLFGKSNEPIRIVQDVYMETIKLVEMWRSFSNNKGEVGVNTPHWINHLTNKLWYIGKPEPYNYQSFFAPLDENTTNLKGEVGKFGKDYAKGRSPEKIVEDEIEYVLNLKAGGQNKYKNVIESQEGISVSPKDYLYFFKFLALSLSGQYTGGPWDNVGFIKRTKVDYSRIGHNFRDKLELQKYLEHLFVEYLSPNDFIK